MTNPLKIKINALARYVLWHYLRAPLNQIVIAEYPKSGGTWLSQLVSTALSIDYPRNQLPSLKPQILHGHFSISDPGNRVIGMMRDGRDVMVSAYFHLLFERPTIPKSRTEYHILNSGIENINDVEDNMPRFIHYMFNRKNSLSKHYTWKEYVDMQLNFEELHIVKYENLLNDTSQELLKVLQVLNEHSFEIDEIESICEKFSFKSQSKRDVGEEKLNVFLRKGIAGDWRNKFSNEACQVFDHYAGDTLISAAYEDNNSWINGSQ